MKRLMKLVVFVALIGLASSCEHDDLNELNNDAALTATPELVDTTGQEATPLTRNSPSQPKPDNSMIIQYLPNTTDAQKVAKRQQYGVVNFKTCTCADPLLELWVFGQLQGGGPVDIEELKATIGSDGDLDGAEFNQSIQQQMGQQGGGGNSIIDLIGTQSNVPLGGTLRVSRNTGVTIAILDTGINYNYDGFPNEFLYNGSRDKNNCIGESGEQAFFGWDFVNQDNDPLDRNGHGTVVASIITSELSTTGIPYQILPIKVFDDNGKGMFFDIICGYKYAVQLDNVAIINMSFGNNEYNSILERVIEESQDYVLAITSAGNDESNNDGTAHYPSSLPSPNVLAVAGLDQGTTSPSNADLASFSNWGVNSVDIAAPSENIPFTVDGETFHFSGTSYAAPFVSYKAATLYTLQDLSYVLYNNVIVASTYSHNLNTIQYSSMLLD